MKNKNEEVIIAESAKIANHFWTRFKGLMLKKSMFIEEALILEPCNSIHTFFMKFDIDILFVDKYKKVIAVKTNIPSKKIITPIKNCKYIVEMAAQDIDQIIKVGQQLEW